MEGVSSVVRISSRAVTSKQKSLPFFVLCIYLELHFLPSFITPHTFSTFPDEKHKAVWLLCDLLLSHLKVLSFAKYRCDVLRLDEVEPRLLTSSSSSSSHPLTGTIFLHVVRLAVSVTDVCIFSSLPQEQCFTLAGVYTEAV